MLLVIRALPSAIFFLISSFFIKVCVACSMTQQPAQQILVDYTFQERRTVHAPWSLKARFWGECALRSFSFWSGRPVHVFYSIFYLPISSFINKSSKYSVYTKFWVSTVGSWLVILILPTQSIIEPKREARQKHLSRRKQSRLRKCKSAVAQLRRWANTVRTAS